MKVFISWSGTRSRKTAELLRQWLPLINQNWEPFVSGEDISKGGNWSQAIIDELNHAEFGILCVTPHNQTKPWLLFEAGALSKQVDNEPKLVAPLLIGFKGKRDLPPPLGRFQTTLPTREDMFKLVKSLNEASQATHQRDPYSLSTVFEKFWDDFEGPFREIERSTPAHVARPRPDGEILAEVLDIVRSLQRESQNASRVAGQYGVGRTERPPGQSARSKAALGAIKILGTMASLYTGLQRLQLAFEGSAVDDTGQAEVILFVRDLGDGADLDTRLDLLKGLLQGTDMDTRIEVVEEDLSMP